MGPVGTGDWGLGLGLDNKILGVLDFLRNYYVRISGPVALDLGLD